MIWLALAFVAGIFGYPWGNALLYDFKPRAGLEDAIGYLVIAPFCIAGAVVAFYLVVDGLLSRLQPAYQGSGISAGLQIILIVVVSLLGSTIGFFNMIGAS